MGFDFSGFVLRPPRTAPSNATTTEEASNGVDRDFKPLSSDYEIASPDLVEIAADQYRTAVLLRPNDSQTEYLVWAANTANLADIAGFEVSGEGTASFPTGTIPVANTNTFFANTTGSNRVIIIDDANRSIGDITSLVVRRGDTGEEFQLVTTGDWNLVTGIFTITNEDTLVALGGGVSSIRGDRVIQLKYVLAAPTFWWSKNDIYGNRFIWDGSVDRWRPLRGTPPRNLGQLLVDTEYTLSPVPLVTVGDFLPGDSGVPDSYCMVRIGTRPDASSVPVASPVAVSGFTGIRMVTDEEIEEFDFGVEPELAGIVSSGTGTLKWNPAFVEDFAGQTIFYSYDQFVDQEETEPLGDLEDGNLNLVFLAPIPGPTDYPFIRIGSRSALVVKFSDTEADLAFVTLEEGEVGISLSTGRLKFSDTDLAKADPEDPGFDNTYLGAQVFYDGVSLTRRPVPLREAVRLVDSGGDPTIVDGKNHSIYIPDAMPTPGVGVSGVLHIPDTTGTIPNTSVPAGIRFGEGSGLIRAFEGPWDLVLFTENGQIQTIRTFDDDDEPPRFRFNIPEGVAYVDKRRGSGGSEVLLGRRDFKRFDGKAMYFLQSGTQPSVYAEDARMVARVRNAWTLVGTEILVFTINNVEVTWNAALDPGGIATSAGGTFTAKEIAASLDAIAPAESDVVAQNGRVILRSTLEVNSFRYGEIEIGFGPNGTKDLSGPAALGFLPGWKIRITGPNQVEAPPELRWLPDNGSHVGVFRSPFNLNGNKDDIADSNHIARFDDVILTSSISVAPVVLLDRPPLEDVAGYDENVFFQIQDGLVQFNLNNYDEVFYEFGIGKFSWADAFRQQQTIEQPTNSLYMGQAPLIPNSFRLPGKGLRLSDLGQPFQDQILNEDFILDADGDSGIAILIETVGALKQLGSRGVFAAGSTTFTDTSPDVDFVELGVLAGWQLKITQGDATGTYVVAENAVTPNSLILEQSFPVAGATIPWELYEGKTREEFDLGVVADTQYTQFQHLPEDPWKVRVLSPLGEVPTTAVQQTETRLVAVLGDALASDREISIRYGLLDTAEGAAMVALTQTDLGTIINSGRNVPDPTGDRFLDDAFSIRVGTKTYSFSEGNLIKISGVLAFPLVGDVIEVQTVTGLLNFGTEVFEQFEGQQAIYVEEFLSPNLVGSSDVEYRPENGELNFPATAFTQFGGTEVYLVETMNTVAGGVDVTLNPIQGSLLFTKPLREFQIVEVHYFQAVSGSGNLLLEPTDPEDPESGLAPVEVTEQLPLFVRLDPATSVDTGISKRWGFNPTKRTVDTDEANEPAFYIGSTLYNIGSSPVATFDIDNDNETYIVHLEEGVDSTNESMITYAVFEAFGGEQTYTVSQFPVYRPPFRIEADQTDFALETDRVAEMAPGKLLRVAEFPFYITASSYNAATDVTTVEFLPETQLEAGSRDPGSDSLSLLSDIPLATDIVPEAPDGFWMPITNPYEPINRGFQSIIFGGDLTAIAVVGHLLELGGIPFIISGSSQIDGGTRTQIDVTSFFPRGFAFGQDAAKISVRPVYQPLPEQFLGRGAVVATEPSELILFGETNDAGDLLPGRTLRPSIDYILNTDDGSIEFLNPPEGPLEPTQSLYLRHTQQRIIAPLLANQFILNPRFDARFVYIQPPSATEDPITGEPGNGRLGKILRATYTFSNPDTFFYRTVPLLSYLGEVAEQVARDIAAKLPSQGPAPAVIPPVENANQGRLGLKSQLRSFEDVDRSARVFLEFYNVNIVNFEQVLESITGNIVGDRDGKFKFFIGKGKELPPPGYEDAITGELNRRNLFSEVFFGYNPKATFMRRDPVVDPTDFTVAGDQLEGSFIDPDFLGDLQNLQRQFAANEVDDVVLFARTRKKLRLFPLRLEAFGRYAVMGRPQRFSRIFPEIASHFTLTDPGIGADLDIEPVNPGVYSFRKKIKRLSIKGSGGNFKIELPKRASTFFKGIADVGNPVLGTVENIGSLTVRNRLPRARVFAYSDTGFPQFDALPFSVTAFAANPRPAVIATPLPLQELPLNGEGLPDITLLAAQGGETIDLTTGDPDLFTPGFSVWRAPKGTNLPKVAFGHPDGTITDVVAGEPLSFEFAGRSFTATKSIFIGEVLFGCIVTFVDEDGVQIGPGELLVEGEEEGTADGPIDLTRGDTVFVMAPDADVTSGNVEEQTNEERAAKIVGNPSYRLHFDVGVDKSGGEIRDISLPSYDDPSIFGLKEVLGQHPPNPLSNIEGVVSFRNARTEPAPIPALTGGFTNDSGDYTLPYLYAENTEIDQLGIVAGSFNNLFADSAIPNAVYPDEIQGADGVIVGALAGGDFPAALNTSLDSTPITTAGAYIPNSGIGDVEPFDVLLVETGQGGLGLPPGSQGILSVGATTGSATGSTIEPPRFVTPTALGNNLRYRFKSAMSFVNQTTLVLPPGMVVRRVGTVTQFDITQLSTGVLVFNDGTPAAIVGGLNDIFNLVSTNIVTINLWTASSIAVPAPVFLQSVTIDFGLGTVTGDAGAPALTTVTADDNFIYVDTPAPFVTIGPGTPPPPALPEDPLALGDTLPLWFTIDINVGGAAGLSSTAQVEQDRLTFSESYDLRTVLPRNESPVAAVAVASELSVDFVAGKTTSSCTVNDDASTNGGVPYTFLTRNTFAPFIGTFIPTPVSRGSVKVMAFEGHSNTPIVTSGDIRFSALPSSRFAEGSAVQIAEGFGLAGTPVDRNFRISSDGATLLMVTGDLLDIRPSDILTITGTDDVPSRAAVTAGTYLVRHAIVPNEPTTQVHLAPAMVTNTLPANTGSGWANPVFPTLVSSNVVSGATLTISSTRLGNGVTNAWDPTGGFLYFVTVLDPAASDYGTLNFKVPYSAVNTTTNTFTITVAGITDFAGGVATAADIDALPLDTLVSGFYRVDVTLDQAPEDQFPRNTVGSLVPVGVDIPVGGFSGIALSGPGVPVPYDIAAANLVAGAPGVDELGVIVATPISNLSFDSNPDAYVYDNVPHYLQLDQSGGNLDWDLLHTTAGLFALMPGDTLATLGPGLVPGFRAQAGVFLEPSWVRPTLNLAGGAERVVDAAHSVGAGAIGYRDPVVFGEADPEPVTWSVRRIRRFHEVLQDIGELLGPLRYVYQIRRGTITDFGEAPVSTESFVYPYVITANDTTNLGPFNDEFVNVNPGDLFRLFDETGVTLLDEVEIGGIESGTQIWLKEPGITKVAVDEVPGKQFEIYLRQVPVPHEQSNEQLFQQITDQVILKRTVDYVSQDGGFVPTEPEVTDPRRLKDSDGTLNFAALGILEGDIVVIDAAGGVEGPTGVPATGQERGTRPFGDRSVPNRLSASAGQEVPFIAGAPSALDDNRGWYRITEVGGDALTVSSETGYSNDPGGGFVTFGVDAEYAVLPTVSGSTAVFADPAGGPGLEGQMDLRPTAEAGQFGSSLNSFLGNLFAIAPFSYTVIRPSKLFSDDAIDLVLLMRERTLSFLEEFDVFFREDKFGNYFVFQRDLHVADLGNPLIPDEGKGVMSNELIDGARGLVNISPYANTTDSLGVLDRRFWVNDSRLDSEFPPGAGAETPSYSTLESNANNPSADEGDGRPVLTDRITEVLDDNDQFRQLRFAWLDFRVNGQSGTLVQIRRFIDELPQKRREELRQLRLAQSFEDGGIT